MTDPQIQQVSVRPMSLRERWAEWKRCWRENDVPHCPECRGCGQPVRSRDYVYWHGVLTAVCMNCGGSGRV